MYQLTCSLFTASWQLSSPRSLASFLAFSSPCCRQGSGPRCTAIQLIKSLVYRPVAAVEPKDIASDPSISRAHNEEYVFCCLPSNFVYSLCLQLLLYPMSFCISAGLLWCVPYFSLSAHRLIFLCLDKLSDESQAFVRGFERNKDATVYWL